MIKFTKEQLDYLNKCSNEMYSGRWKIGKDYFRALDEYLCWLNHTQDKNIPFESFKEIDMESKDYPF